MKTKISSTWPHDSRHFHFERTHQCNLPFVNDEPESDLLDSILGVIALAGLLAVVLLVGGAL